MKTHLFIIQQRNYLALNILYLHNTQLITQMNILYDTYFSADCQLSTFKGRSSYFCQQKINVSILLSHNLRNFQSFFFDFLLITIHFLKEDVFLELFDNQQISSSYRQSNPQINLSQVLNKMMMIRPLKEQIITIKLNIYINDDVKNNLISLQELS
ncbi:hypothetical protein pb186bvf_020184 [Paramecium bursaria]